MEASRKPNRIHPLVAGAAVSVMLASLTGVAAITGILPTSYSSDVPEAAAAIDPAASSAPIAAAPATPAATEPAAPPVASKPAPAPVARQTRATPARTAQNYSPAPVAQAPAVCHSCGRVESVQVIQQEAQPSGVGMVAGALIGGALGNQVGGGNGRKLATVAGAIGGGYAGNRIERTTRGTTSYQVHVRMEGGELRSFPYAQQPSWNIGDRVRVVNGQLAARG